MVSCTAASSASSGGLDKKQNATIRVTVKLKAGNDLQYNMEESRDEFIRSLT